MSPTIFPFSATTSPTSSLTLPAAAFASPKIPRYPLLLYFNHKEIMEGVEMNNLDPSLAAGMAGMQPEEQPQRRVVSEEEVHAKLGELNELHGYDEMRGRMCFETFPLPYPPLRSPKLCVRNFP